MKFEELQVVNGTAFLYQTTVSVLTLRDLHSRWLQAMRELRKNSRKDEPFDVDALTRYKNCLLALSEVADTNIRRKALALLGAISVEARTDIWSAAERDLIEAALHEKALYE